MPAKKCSEGNKVGWSWGDSGKCYLYDPEVEGSEGKAKQKAYLQGISMGDKVSEEEKLEMIAFEFANNYTESN